MSGEHVEFEESFPQMTEEDLAELNKKVDWETTEEDSVPKVGGPAEELGETPEEETDAKSEGEEDETPEDEETEKPEVDSEDAVEYELPDGTKLTAQQIQELLTAEKRFKDTQAYSTRLAQENAELNRLVMQNRLMQQQTPQFEPSYYGPQPPAPQQLEDNYATETERLLAEQLKGVQSKLQQIEYNNWQREQAELKRRTDELIGRFRENHKDLGDDQVAAVLRKANETGTYDLELVYNGMRDIEAEREMARKQAREELIADLRKKGKAKISPSGSPAKKPPPLDVSKLSEDEIEALMTADAKRIFKG